jgi:NADH-quinone oxidoreductase subunit H
MVSPSCSRSRSCSSSSAGSAETNRATVRPAEAEQELTGGFHTEYSGMRLRAVFLAEYANMIVVSSSATTLLLGGGCGRSRTSRALSFLGIIPAGRWFLIKSSSFLYVFIWVRADAAALRLRPA